MALLGAYTDAVLSISILINFTALFGFWLTGIGKSILLRIRQTWKHKKGGYANTIFVRKNGTASEVFRKVDPEDKTLKIDNEKYAIDRRKTINYDGIPTMLHFEGITEPQDWNEPAGMSTGELQQIIENNKKEGFLEMLKQYYPVVLVFVGIVILVCLLSAYLNWQIYDVVVQGGTGSISGR